MRTQAILGLMLATAAVAAAQSAPGRVRVHGVIASVSNASLVVTTETGPRKIALSPSTMVIGEVKSSLAAVEPGSFIGTTVEQRPDGSLESVEVHIFPPEMKGTGEGYRPMAAPNTMMANATVAKVEAPHMMANATVKSVGSSEGSKTVVLVYAGGSKTVRIGPNVPVVAFKPATKALLTPGAHVSVFASQSGDELTASRVSVGEGGLVPR